MYNNKVPVNFVYERIGESIAKRIDSEPDSFILGTATDTLIEYYYTANHFTPIEIDSERTELIEIKKFTKIIPAHAREGPFQSEGDLQYQFESIFLTIPIKSNAQVDTIKDFQASTFSIGGPLNSMVWNTNTIVLEIPIRGYGFNKADEQIEREIKNGREGVINKLNYLAADINTLNTDLLVKIKHWVEVRRQKIIDDEDRHTSLLKKINIPVKKKENEDIKRIEIKKSPIVQSIRPIPHKPEEYQINRQDVMDIIYILNNQGRQFEKTPITYTDIGEEGLRNVLLVNLNTVFEGRATGETFIAKGKSDIYLNIDKGNILIFECKIWGGSKLYNETIEQLLKYLTWRNNYGVIITFAKQKGFTGILENSKTAIQADKSYRRGFHEIATTHFLSHHVLPGDEHKHVEIHHLFYNLFV